MSNKVINIDDKLKTAWIKVIAELQKAAEDPSHPFRNIVLTSVDQSNHPVNRTVVLRDIVHGEHILIYTDSRSDKVRQIEDNNKVSMLFYDENKKLQLRVKGHGKIYRNGLMVEDHLKYISRKSASSYTTVKSPGKKITEPSEGWEWNENNLENFCVIDIKMIEMEFLQLDRNKHMRSRRTLHGGQWEESWLVP